jgi:hypothetical protein
VRTLALCLLAGCGAGSVGDDGGDDQPHDQPRTEAHQVCVDETNRYREIEGRPAIAWSGALEAYADEGAEYDHHAQPHDHFSMTPDGERIAFGENECPRWDLSFGGGDIVALMEACVQAFYDEGPGGGHYEIMMDDYGTMGCGIYEEEGVVTIVQDYGF